MTTVSRTPETAMNTDFRATGDSLGSTKPNGPALAALLSAGIGSAVLGIFTTLAQSHTGFRALMDIDKNLGFAIGVGPLSGKTIYAVAAWLISWAIAGFLMRGKSYEARRFFIATFILIGIGLLGTFPVFFENFPVLAK